MTAYASILLSLLLQTTLLLGVGLLALRLTRRHGPTVQSWIGRATLVSVACLLLAAPLTGTRPALWRIWLPEGTHPLASLPVTWQVPPATGGLGDMAADLPPAHVRYFPPEPSQDYVAEAKAATPRPPVAGNPLRSRWQHKEVGSSLAALWLTGTTALLLWLGLCQWHLMRLRRTAFPVTSGPPWETLASLTPHPPSLLTHPSVVSPFLAGVRHPAIFLPPSYEIEFDGTALRAIFVHELAHLDRRDNAWTLAARLLCALLWPQPLLWTLCRRLEQSGEEACDEAVLARDCSPRAYADCLLTLAARQPLGRRERALGAGVAPFRSSVGRRIAHILAKGTPSMSPVSPRLRLGILACAVSIFGGASLVSCAPIKETATASPVSSDSFRQAQFLAGLTAVTGPGIIVTLTDSKKPPLPNGMLPPDMTPPNLVHDTDINQVVNELKAGGAEAIAVNDQRLIATTSVRSTGATISVNGIPQTPPYRVVAIGDAKTLVSLMNLPGGIASQLKVFDPTMFSIHSTRVLVLPAYSGKGQLHYAKPVTATTMKPIWDKWADAVLLKDLIAKRNQLTEQLRNLDAQSESVMALRQATHEQTRAGAKVIAQLQPLSKNYQIDSIQKKQRSAQKIHERNRLLIALANSEAKSIQQLQSISIKRIKLQSAIHFFNAQIASRDAVAGER